MATKFKITRDLKLKRCPRCLSTQVTPVKVWESQRIVHYWCEGCKRTVEIQISELTQI